MKSTTTGHSIQIAKMPASKLLMLQQNHIKDSTIMSTAASATAAAPYINGQQNGNTKVVLVTSDSMEIDHSRNGKTTTPSSNGTDEELTSLTWLHDKNLLKGTTNQSHNCEAFCPRCSLFINSHHFRFILCIFIRCRYKYIVSAKR